MYVEVAVTCANADLLLAFCDRCPVLRNLHVHAVLETPPGTSCDAMSPELHNPAFLVLMANMFSIEDLTTLKYSCQQETPLKLAALLEAHEPIRMFSLQDHVRYNFAAVTDKPKTNVSPVWLSDVVTQNMSLRCFEQATVCLEANIGAPSLFVQATASPERWSHIRGLTLALSYPYKATCASHFAVMHKGYVEPMRRFFDTCVSKIAELNMTAFHFGVDCDGCKLVASALPKLRALALPPCGFFLADSLQSLADGCLLLEHLDKRTRLRRLTIDETVKVANLAFLSECRVEELRLSLDGVIDEYLAEFPTELGDRLALNTRLASLTLVACQLSLSERVAKNLWQVESLRHLCILTAASQTRSAAKDFFESLGSRMPRLLSAHAYYVCDGRNVRSSWIPRWRRDCGMEPSEGTSRAAQGVYLDDKPCLGRLCCVDTFIGLVRPRNRC
ncbi:hypothetical protein MRX96_011176 [Rhipicephalus microplus]